ncbi:hypothetical protein CGMCC3_g16409 [Colletotrichum fructicola]|uniref:Uncharacterized protein n=1 Tax=Colletotrichum fructicola (strain Nara gc5) TaxID=1213859 RepID=L2FHZ3_COLFN|nr:uncharacterized protein CGMCC3_g16409 [Colletotrichum fructicola]KAE9567448.1 hypothetical protein CGMCC3_g16409 [Colletotrichum fructicola]KAF4474154.1 hypothetical protein CGGC5_v017160 [Colletotrichum fructicola Nara gc5]
MNALLVPETGLITTQTASANQFMPETVFISSFTGYGYLEEAAEGDMFEPDDRMLAESTLELSDNSHDENVSTSEVFRLETK